MKLSIRNFIDCSNYFVELSSNSI